MTPPKTSYVAIPGGGRPAPSGRRGLAVCPPLRQTADGFRGSEASEDAKPLDPVTENAILGARKGFLRPKQVRELATLARKAWRIAGQPTGETFDDWRHGVCRDQVGKKGLTDLRQEDVSAVRGYFLKVIGDQVGAFRQLRKNRKQTDRELAYAKLVQECREADATGLLGGDPGLALQYANGFLLKKRKVTAENAGAKDLWHAIITLRNGISLRKQRAEAGRPMPVKTLGAGSGEQGAEKTPAAGLRVLP